MCLDEIDATQKFSNNTHSSLRNVFQTHKGKIRLIAAGVSVKHEGWHLPTSPWYNFFEFKKVRISSCSSFTSLCVITNGFFFVFHD